VSRSKKKPSARSPQPASPEEAGPETQPPKNPAPKKRRKPPWGESRHPVLRFVLVFAILMGVFEVWFIGYFSKGNSLVFVCKGDDTFRSYLQLTARACSTVLSWMGNRTRVSGESIISPEFSVRIVRGCDALEPSALFLAAVVAFPAPLLAKGVGIASGVLSLQIVNCIRIVSLFYIGIHFPKAFKVMHYEVWQAVFIFLALLFWLIWARWATRHESVKADGSA